MAGKKCSRCTYRRQMSTLKVKGGSTCCAYCIVTGERRPCPADDNCTVFKRRKKGEKITY